MDKKQKKTLIISIIFVFVLLLSLITPPSQQPTQEQKPDPASHSEIASENVDFGPYMKKVQRKIKKNWRPPSENSDKKVVVLFKVLKNGKIKSYKIVQSSKNAKMDASAILALKKSSPLNKLPKEFGKASIDIEFTFDYKTKHKITQKK